MFPGSLDASIAVLPYLDSADHIPISCIGSDREIRVPADGSHSLFGKELRDATWHPHVLIVHRFCPPSCCCKAKHLGKVNGPNRCPNPGIQSLGQLANECFLDIDGILDARYT